MAAACAYGSGWLLIGCGVLFCGRASHSGGEFAGADLEVAFLKNPFAVVAHVCKVRCRQLERDGACLAGLEFYFLESTQAAVVGHNARRCQVGGIEHHGLFAGHVAAVGHIHAERQHVAVGEFVLLGPQVAVFKGGVAQTIAEGPLVGDGGIVVVGACHRAHLLGSLEVVGRQSRG